MQPLRVVFSNNANGLWTMWVSSIDTCCDFPNLFVIFSILPSS